MSMIGSFDMASRFRHQLILGPTISNCVMALNFLLSLHSQPSEKMLHMGGGPPPDPLGCAVALVDCCGHLYFMLFGAQNRRLVLLGASESGNPSSPDSRRLDSNRVAGKTAV
ncbi:hypothetical protein B0T14DRAFT_563246 [Immersiella caudata]|uniref:Uncharacterized protein n=1 Tax=Immersiella caudata TaxID=314043 RepID=A0AA40C7G6_9PEZI|nr:hypothetical protein B0T14DRAFT_563246 [Immersiella caudata]